MTDSRRQMVAAVLQKYASDPAFKAKLLDNPASALADSGLMGKVETRSGEDECGGAGTCSKTCGYPTCDDTCGMITCAISV